MSILIIHIMPDTHYPPTLNNNINVFVFGSNVEGRHGAGAARAALINWQARYGQGNGPQGNAYAIPTKDARLKPISLKRIESYVNTFKHYAAAHFERTFLVTRIGCGLAGYKDADIAPFFKDVTENVTLPEAWVKILTTMP